MSNELAQVKASELKPGETFKTSIFKNEFHVSRVGEEWDSFDGEWVTTVYVIDNHDAESVLCFDPDTLVTLIDFDPFDSDTVYAEPACDSHGSFA